MVLGVNLAMLVAGIGESAKKYSTWRLFRQTSTPVSSSPNGVFLSKTVILPSRVLGELKVSGTFFGSGFSVSLP